MQKKKHKNQNQVVTGTIHATRGGLGFVAHPDLEEDVRIEKGNLNTALNGDAVEIEITSKKHGQQPGGRVVRVVRRAKKHFVGVVERDKGAYVLVPDDKRMYTNITIAESHDIKTNEKVLVEIDPWDDPHKPPTGTVTKIIGPKGDHEVEIQSILYENNIIADFPSDVARAAKNIETNWDKEGPTYIEQAVASGERRDFRTITTFTIDPDTAKDFDDGLSIIELENGMYEIGVHIADVSHYVRPKTELDDEAKERGFSSYLVDRTIPMLPPELSSDICSLNPNLDRLTFSVVVTVDKDGNTHDHWFGKGVMHSDKRFTYKEAQDLLDSGNKDARWFKELSVLDTLSRKLREQRFKEGAIDFDQEEVEVEIDENGVPLRIYKKESLQTHKLIEEWMLVANREVARFIYEKHGNKDKEKGFIYRVHDLPDKEKLAELALLVKALGYDFIKPGQQAHARDIGRLFKQIEGEPVEGLIKTAMVRSMSKAQYSTKNIGHFGLGFDHYTHFTSPIRRYSDMLVHRVLLKHLQGQEVTAAELSSYKMIAKSLSEKEKDIQQAERDSIKFKQVEYWSARIGEEIEGVITGVKEWGVYVADIETGAEGLVPVREIKDDYYTFDARHYSLVGEKTKKKYTLGDTVHVKVVAADVDRKTLDFTLV